MLSSKSSRAISKRFVAVDFDSRRLHVVEAERVSRNLRVGRLASVEVPAGVDVTDAQNFGEFLRGVLKEMKLSHASLLMTVNRSDAVFKPLTLPPGTDPDEMAGMVQYQMQGELPYRPEEAVIDFTVESHYDAEPTGPEESAGVDLLVAAVKLPVVDRYRQIAHAAGAKLLRLGLRPYADRTCVEACIDHRADEAVAIVHVTNDETEIDVTTGTSLTFSRPAVIKIPADVEDLDEKRQSLVSTVSVEVARSLRSYTAVEGKRSIERVLIVGGTGLEEQVAEHLTERMHVPAEKLDPAESFRIRELTGDQDASAFATALGLAVGGRGEELPFDFLNPKQPIVKRDLRKVRLAVMGVLAALVLVLAFFFYQKRVLAPREARIASLRKALKKQERISDMRKVEEERVEAQTELSKEQSNYLPHLARISAALPGAQSLYIRHLRSEPKGFRFEAHGVELGTIQIELRERLEAAGYSVSLNTSERVDRPRDSRYGHRAEVTVTFPEKVETDLTDLPAAARPADDVSDRKGYQR